LKNSAATRNFTTPDSWPPEIFPPANRAVLRAEAAAAGFTGERLALRIRDYRGTVIRASRRHAELRLSLHTALAAASTEVFGAALRCVLRRLRRRPPAAEDRGLLAAFCRELAENSAAEAAVRPGKAAEPRGRFFDLAEIFARVNAHYFQGQLHMRTIGWTRGAARRRLAYCRPESGEIRVSRLLDRPDVPSWFLDYLVYHEALHLLLPPPSRRSRNQWHHRQFRAMEQAFPHYAAAQRFKEKLPRLLSKPPKRKA
jgi:hypothetical protein